MLIDARMLLSILNVSRLPSSLNRVGSFASISIRQWGNSVVTVQVPSGAHNRLLDFADGICNQAPRRPQDDASPGGYSRQ
jgi:hypothetical protein